MARTENDFTYNSTWSAAGKQMTGSVQVQKAELTEREIALGAEEKYIITNLTNGQWFMTVRCEDTWISGAVYTQATPEVSTHA